MTNDNENGLDRGEGVPDRAVPRLQGRARDVARERRHGRGREVLEAVNKHAREWRAENPLTITREMCLERIADFERAREGGPRAASTRRRRRRPPSPRASRCRRRRPSSRRRPATTTAARRSGSDQLEQLGDAPSVEVPNGERPAAQETVLEVFPKAMEIAPETVKRLLALVVIPNEDLRKADEEDRAIDALDELGKELFYEGLIEELLELAVRLDRGDRGRGREVPRAAGESSRRTWRSDLAAGQTTTRSRPSPEPATTSTSESPTESTSSPADTDGPERDPLRSPLGRAPWPLRAHRARAGAELRHDGLRARRAATGGAGSRPAPTRRCPTGTRTRRPRRPGAARSRCPRAGGGTDVRPGAFDAGSVEVRLGADFDQRGFDEYDRAIERAKRTRAPSSTRARRDVDSKAFDQYEPRSRRPRVGEAP
jgi:hypothetical protein